MYRNLEIILDFANLGYLQWFTENYLKNYPEKTLPHNFNPFPVLELVRGGIGEGVLAADKGAVDAVGFNRGNCGAVLNPRHNPFGA